MKAFTPDNTTIIICCAGMGTRLGIGTTKALVDIDGIPLIIRLLEMLNEYDDVRVVVGYQAEKVIEVVNSYRKDIMFAFNYKFETTGVADSLRKGMIVAREYIVSIDGDILINPDDFRKFLECEKECLGITKITSEELVYANVNNGIIENLSKEKGNWQWPGLLKIKRERLKGESPHVCNMLNEIMPIPGFVLRAREINTQEDYEKFINWFKRGLLD